MACKSCRRRAAQWAELRGEYNRLDPDTDAAARRKIEVRVSALAARVADCCGPAEAKRLLKMDWPEISN